MDEKPSLNCPLKKLASTGGTTGGGSAIKAMLSAASNQCDDECAWFIDGKCAITVIAETFKKGPHFVEL